MLKQFFLSIGCSWTLSTLLPFFLIALVAFFIVRLFTRRVKRKPVRIIIILVVVLAALGGYFAVEPIYQGDLTNDYVTKEIPKELKKTKKNELIVITIPGCPYCMASVDMCNKLIERNKNLKVTYIVISKDKAAIKPYKAVASNSIRFKLSKDSKEMVKCADSSFPAFVMVSDGKLKQWSNNNLGPSALDDIEDAANTK